MESKIQMWGNSLALRIPKAYAEQIGLRSNSPVKLSVVDTQRVVEPIQRVRLADLLADVTPENIHAETDWGAPTGNEVW